MLSRHGCAVTLLFVSSGCTAYTVSIVEPPADAPSAALPAGRVARACVVRSSALAAPAPVVVRDNGRLMGATSAESYFCYQLEPGEHEVESVFGDDVDRDLGTSSRRIAKLEADSGGSYFLHHEVMAFGAFRVRWVDRETFEELRDGCDYVRLSAVPGDEALPSAFPVARAQPLKRRP